VLHVYFPDPWPKARHHKRRLIQEPFLKQAQRVLVPGGRLQIVTDHQD
jgi:tRNA (guanine-N7-)-methyltransferase